MSFNIIPHDQWLEKIKKELKKEDLSDFQVQLPSNITIDPFFGRKPLDSKGHRIEKPWSHTQQYFSSSLQNKILLEDLAGGINKVEIVVDSTGNDWKKLLNEIIFDYIDLSFILTDSISREDLTSELSVFPSPFPIQHPDYTFTNDAVDFPAQLTQIFQQIINILDNCSSPQDRQEIFQQLRINRKISARTISELAISDTIQILSHNICKGFNMKSQAIQMHAYCQPESDDLEKNYIDLSLKALNAGLAHYDSICIAPASSAKASFHHRISRNIHHLLKEEALLHQSRSAFRGSYQVEQITEKLCQHIWQNIS